MPIALLDHPAPTDDATRRQFLVGGVFLAALLAGCSTAAPAPAMTSSAGFPVTISHRYGSTEIAEAPQRIVAVGLTEQDVLLALGIRPVGTREWFGEQPGALWPWARDLAGGTIPEVLGFDIDFETLAALEPDLILGVAWGVTAEEYPKLSRIAPTVAQSADFVDGGTPWQDQTRIIGRAVGQEQRAGDLVAAVEQKIAAAARANPRFAGATAVVAYEFDGQFGVYGPQDPRVRLMTALGFGSPPQIAEVVGDEFYAAISSEQLALLDADVALWLLGNEASATSVREQPLYRTLDVARQGRDVYLVGLNELSYASYSWSTVLSLPVALDQLVPALTAAIDGDPTTVARP